MAEGGETCKKPYLICYADNCPSLKVPIIMVVDVEQEASMTPEREEDNPPLVEMQSSSLSPIQMQSRSIRDETLLKASSCPNFDASSYSIDSANNATSPCHADSMGANPDPNPDPEEAVDGDTECQDGEESNLPRRRVKKYSKKEYLNRRRTKPVIPSPYPSPTHLSIDEDDGEEDKMDGAEVRMEEKKIGDKEQDAGSK